jgi:hypothetical protein
VPTGPVCSGTVPRRRAAVRLVQVVVVLHVMAMVDMEVVFHSYDFDSRLLYVVQIYSDDPDLRLQL